MHVHVRTYIYMYVFIRGTCARYRSVGYGLSVTARSENDYSLSTTTVCQATCIIMNSDEKREARPCRERERRAAESSEQRETRLIKRCVADRVGYAANSDGRTERHKECHKERRTAESFDYREKRLARRSVEDRARYAAMTAERSPCPANESHDIAEIGFRDCRAKRSPSPANECHGTAWLQRLQSKEKPVSSRDMSYV